MIKIAICEDDEKDRNRLVKLVEKYKMISGKQYEWKCFETGEQFMDSGFSPDILFLDIFLGDRDGIQIGTELKKRNLDILIIYTTCFDEQILVAFNKIHSFGFLIKPITENALFSILIDALEKVAEKRKEITFLLENHTVVNVAVNDIYYFEYINRRINIIAKENSYTCREKIGDIAKRMEPYGFLMSHQSFVVNLSHVENILPQALIMKNGDKVVLAQKRAALLRRRLMQMAKDTAESERNARLR